MSEKALSFIDVETTGTESESDRLLQVACLVTDLDLNILDEVGFNEVIHYPYAEIAEMRDNAAPVVQEMHDKTGLWNKLPSGLPMTTVDSRLQEYIAQFVAANESWLGGNSLFLDRSFLKENLPLTFGHLHYRDLNVTSWAGPVRWWAGAQFRKKTTHEAMSDIRESIEEMRFFRRMLFPGRPLAAYEVAPEGGVSDN